MQMRFTVVYSVILSELVDYTLRMCGVFGEGDPYP